MPIYTTDIKSIALKQWFGKPGTAGGGITGAGITAFYGGVSPAKNSDPANVQPNYFSFYFEKNPKAVGSYAAHHIIPISLVKQTYNDKQINDSYEFVKLLTTKGYFSAGDGRQNLMWLPGKLVTWEIGDSIPLIRWDGLRLGGRGLV
jgi:hypothetical protein